MRRSTELNVIPCNSLSSKEVSEELEPGVFLTVFFSALKMEMLSCRELKTFEKRPCNGNLDYDRKML